MSLSSSERNTTSVSGIIRGILLSRKQTAKIPSLSYHPRPYFDRRKNYAYSGKSRKPLKNQQCAKFSLLPFQPFSGNNRCENRNRSKNNGMQREGF
jgi:hypothetical protein